MVFATNDNPIFIGGDGRSGTTLLSIILDSHPQLAVGAEMHFRSPKNLGPYILDFLALDKTASGGDEWSAAKKFIVRCERVGVTRDQTKEMIEDSMRETGTDLDEFPDRCSLMQKIGSALRVAAHKPRWGLKIMRDIKIVKRYAKCWPGAAFIHIVRDGRDVAASQMKEHASWGYKNIEQAAEIWSGLVLRGAELSNGKKKLKLATIRYEDIVNDTEPALRKLCEDIGVDWDPALLNHTSAEHVFMRGGKTHPSHAQISRPINDSAFGRYKRDLTPEQITSFNTIAREALELMRYPID